MIVNCPLYGIWYFIRIPISCCESRSYSSWGSTQNIKHDIIHDINRHKQLKDRTTCAAYISIHTPKISRSNRGEALNSQRK